MRPAVSRMIICLCVLLVMAVPVLVRLPSAAFPDMTDTQRSAFRDRDGRYYMTDPDSYYHVRIVNNHLETGRIGDRDDGNGSSVDSRSFYPEGRGTNYSPGIVLLTEAVWKPLHAVFGTGLYDVEYCLSAVMAALAGLAAFLLGWRISGKWGGLVAGLLVSCAPVFVQRTMFSRFDTDMFVVLMDVLLILFLSEALRAKSRGRRILFSAGFAACAWIYSQCWTAVAVALITGFTLFAGMLYILWEAIGSGRKGSKAARRVPWFRNTGLYVVAGSGIGAFALLVLSHGFGFFRDILSYARLTGSTDMGTGTLPNVFNAIAELSMPDIFPDSFARWFWDAGPDREISVLTGIGGGTVAVLALAGLAGLILPGVKRFHRDETTGIGLSAGRMYGCLLLVTLACWAFLIRYGLRFVEHLSVSAGLLAGTAVGRLGWRIRGKKGRAFWLRAGACAVLSAAAIVPAAAASIHAISGIYPAVSRVSDDAMRWIRENAEDPDAVIATWWDNGYFYEAASGHPCLWDGGSTDSLRAVLISKALVTHNPELSRRILLMLSSSGNRAVEYLLERTDPETAFDTVWEALPLSKAETEALMMRRFGMTEAEAGEAEALLHPETAKETYLIISDMMMMQMGWFEYYAFWDFGGDNPPPLATSYRYTPDGYPYNSPEGQSYMKRIRLGETIWRLYMNEEEDERFTLVYSGDDGVENLWMWRVSRDGE